MPHEKKKSKKGGEKGGKKTGKKGGEKKGKGNKKTEKKSKGKNQKKVRHPLHTQSTTPTEKVTSHPSPQPAGSGCACQSNKVWESGCWRTKTRYTPHFLSYPLSSSPSSSLFFHCFLLSFLSFQTLLLVHRGGRDLLQALWHWKTSCESSFCFLWCNVATCRKSLDNLCTCTYFPLSLLFTRIKT